MNRPSQAYLESDVADAHQLQDLREHVGHLAAASGFSRDGRGRAVLAIHEAAALACRLVDGVGVLPGDRCTVRIHAGPEELVAEIDLPGTTAVPTDGRPDDPLRYVRAFASDTGWADGPGARCLRVAVRDEGCPATRP